MAMRPSSAGRRSPGEMCLKPWRWRRGMEGRGCHFSGLDHWNLGVSLNLIAILKGGVMYLRDVGSGSTGKVGGRRSLEYHVAASCGLHVE